MKTITVTTNDTTTPESNLTVSGNVDKFVTIKPSVLRLNGKVGEELKSVVTIIPEIKYPFSISKVRAQDGRNIKYELKENQSDSGLKEYSVTVENLKKDAGSYYDVLILETDSKIQAEIKINVMSRIMAPTAPAQTALTNSVQNNGTIVNGVPANKNSANSNTEHPNPFMAPTSESGERNKANGNNFLEIIQKIQEQNATGVNANAVQNQKVAPVQDPKRAEELRKKFEALIKQAQEQQKSQGVQKSKE